MMATAAEEICYRCPISDNSDPPLSFENTRKNQDKAWKLRFIYLQCYFLSIATILGTGILGLPVTIAHAGPRPFLISFVIGFFIQGLLIYLFVDLLQRCQAAQMESVKTSETERILMEDIKSEEPPCVNEEDEEIEEEEPDTGLLQREVMVKRMEEEEEEEEVQPSFHTLGVLFLGKHSRHAFEFVLLFQFVSIGISYVLAGSEAYAALLHTSHIYVIPAFSWTLSLVILLAQVIIQPIMSLLTLLKGSLLIVTVVVTFVVGSEVQMQTMNDLSQIGRPFLMGTVALGGIVNVMPFLFSEISNDKTQIKWFRRAVLGGLATCALLNVLWCWAVLEIVPQRAVMSVMKESYSNTSDNMMETSPLSTVPVHKFVYFNISLEESERAGEIATIPLTKILNQRYSGFSWLAQLLQIFITISLTVSFLVMGSAMKHTIDGLVNFHWKAEWSVKMSGKTLPLNLQWLRMRSVSRALVSMLAFGLIFLVSICDPQGFIVMLDKVVSLSLNTEMGLFIFLMLRTSRSKRFQHLAVPLPVGERMFRLHWVLPVYFLFAVAYDVLQSLAEVVERLSLSGPTHSNSSLL